MNNLEAVRKGPSKAMLSMLAEYHRVKAIEKSNGTYYRNLPKYFKRNK